MNTTCCQKSQKLATTIPVHLFAIRGRRNYFFLKIALGTRLRNWSYLMNNDLIWGMTDSIKKLRTIHRKTAEPEPHFYNVASLTLQLY